MMPLVDCILIVISIFFVLHVDAIYNEPVFLSNRTKRSAIQRKNTFSYNFQVDSLILVCYHSKYKNLLYYNFVERLGR